MKLKWWQWSLVGLFGIGVLNAIVDPPPKAPVKAAPTFDDPDAKFVAISGTDIFAMTFAPGADPKMLPELARDQCGPRSFCKVVGWTDPKAAARGFPMTDREVGSLRFQYSLNRNTGFEQSLWDCKRWRQPASDSCLS